MAKKYKQTEQIHGSTIITVVAENDKEIVVKDMSYEKAVELLKKKNSFSYKFYQQGYCSLKSKKK